MQLQFSSRPLPTLYNPTSLYVESRQPEKLPNFGKWFFFKKRVDTRTFGSAGLKSVGATETPIAPDESCEVHGKFASEDTPHDDQSNTASQRRNIWDF